MFHLDSLTLEEKMKGGRNGPKVNWGLGLMVAPVKGSHIRAIFGSYWILLAKEVQYSIQ